jgi:predicted RNA-binding protein YlqC (UPF0109 family)
LFGFLWELLCNYATWPINFCFSLTLLVCYNGKVKINRMEKPMSTIDQQFVEYIVKTLVNNPDKVKIERIIDEKGVLLSLEVDPEDVGRIIGRRGATAQSIRTLLRALGTKNDARYNLKIVNNDDYVPGNREQHEDRGAVVADDSFASEDVAAADDAAADQDIAATDDTVEEGNELAEKTRAELADLDDLDI